MSNTCEVSVVMSVYNGAKYLRAAIESVLRQQDVAFEFIIVDDGSTDTSPLILQEAAAADSRIQLIRQSNAGLTRALILGCSIARGEFIARQDADDVSLPGRFRAQVELLRSDPRLSFVSCQAQVISPDGSTVVTHRRPVQADAATELLLHGGSSPPGHGSVMFRRTAYEEVGGYRSEFYYAQDCDLWFRLAERGMLSYAAACLYQYRLDPSSVSGCNSIAKRAFANAVDTCRELRESGQSESSVLVACRQFPIRDSSGASSSEAVTLYFLGRNLLKDKPQLAFRYLLHSICLNPWNPKSWICLALAPLFSIRAFVGWRGL